MVIEFLNKKHHLSGILSVARIFAQGSIFIKEISFCFYFEIITIPSISTKAFLGRLATPNAARAG